MTEPKHGQEHLDGKYQDWQQHLGYREDLKKSLIQVSNPLALLEMAHDAIIVRDIDSVVQFWNQGATELYGWDAREAAGQVTHSLLDTKFPAKKEDVDWALLNIGQWEGELSHRRKDGSRLRVSSRQALRRNEDGQPVFILEINRDVTHNSYLQLLQEVAVAASESRTVQDAVRVCLVSICEHTGWCVGRTCLLTARESGKIDCRTGIWHLADEARFAAFRDFTEENSDSLGNSLAARVFRTRETVWVNDVKADSYFSDSPARQAGLESAFALPIVAGSEVVAVLELFSENPMDMNEHFMAVLVNVGRQLGRVFERVAAEESQRRLSSSLLRSQDDERRRIARELHDSAGQYLAGIKMFLDRVRRENGDLSDASKEHLDEATGMVKKCETEIRTLSYLLHPPLLDELGLASSARWFVDGFAARSGVRVNLEASPELGRLDQAVELTLFRILQECLTNIHRHSESTTADIKIESNGQAVSLEVSDQGKGIAERRLGYWSAPSPREGVGINGMRERLKELGGKLEIRSNKQGTTVRATIPLTSAPSAQ